MTHLSKGALAAGATMRQAVQEASRVEDADLALVEELVLGYDHQGTGSSSRRTIKKYEREAEEAWNRVKARLEIANGVVIMPEEPTESMRQTLFTLNTSRALMTDDIVAVYKQLRYLAARPDDGEGWIGEIEE